jgi:hypothetical protein
VETLGAIGDQSTGHSSDDVEMVIDNQIPNQKQNTINQNYQIQQNQSSARKSNI